MADSVVVAQGLGKQFFRKGRDSARYFDAVLDADMSLRSGELVVLMGRSGSGKSTFLNMLGGLLEPTSGDVLVAGQRLYALDDAELSKFRNAHIGVVPQGQTVLHSLSVVQNVMLPAALYGHVPEAESAALDLLDSLGLRDLADSCPSELSGGEARRVAIARALMMKPQVVLADEPTADLDDENTHIVLGLLANAARNGAAVLVVTHEADAKPYADRVFTMDAGRLAESRAQS